MRYIAFFTGLLLFAGCEQEYIPAIPDGGPKLVVEGHLEAGQDPIPTYVILTRTFDFFGELGPDDFNNSFVHDADVRVHDGQQEFVLQEICFADLDPAIQAQVANLFGFDAELLEVNFCLYVDVLNLINPVQGKTYSLRILADGQELTAETTIPPYVPLDSLRFQSPPGKPDSTLAQLRCYVADPPGMRNFYRYFGSTNGSPFETGFSSVEEDLFFDGKAFEFFLFNPQTTDADAEPDEFGLYFVGDTVTIKWCTIDAAHFDFWNTLEFGNANQGPFASYTRLQSNINGGLGIWGGYHVRYYTLVVEY